MSTSTKILRGETMKNGDTLPSLRVQLFEAGDPFNLSDFDVSMKMKKTDEEGLVVDNKVEVKDSSRGIVEYSWSNGETSTSGTYLLEFVADNESGSTITFPNESFERLYIDDGLGT